VTEKRCAAVDLSALLILGQLKLLIPQCQYSYHGTSAAFSHTSSTFPGCTCNIESLVTPARAQFYNICILRITEPLHVPALTSSSVSLHQRPLKHTRQGNASKAIPVHA